MKAKIMQIGKIIPAAGVFFIIKTQEDENFIAVQCSENGGITANGAQMKLNADGGIVSLTVLGQPLDEGFVALDDATAQYNGIKTIPECAKRAYEIGYWEERHSKIPHGRYIDGNKNASTIDPPNRIVYACVGTTTANLIWFAYGEVRYVLKETSLLHGVN